MVVVVVVVVVVFKLIHIGFTHLVAVDFKISKRGQYVKTQKYCLCLFFFFQRTSYNPSNIYKHSLRNSRKVCSKKTSVGMKNC